MTAEGAIEVATTYATDIGIPFAAVKQAIFKQDDPILHLLGHAGDNWIVYLTPRTPRTHDDDIPFAALCVNCNTKQVARLKVM